MLAIIKRTCETPINEKIFAKKGEHLIHSRDQNELRGVYVLEFFPTYKCSKICKY